MKTMFLSASLVLIAGCLPPPAGCAPNATSCMNDRPYVCSGTARWTPVGDTACASVGAVCCMTAEAVHACVPQSACTGE